MEYPQLLVLPAQLMLLQLVLLPQLLVLPSWLRVLLSQLLVLPAQLPWHTVSNVTTAAAWSDTLTWQMLLDLKLPCVGAAPVLQLPQQQLPNTYNPSVVNHTVPGLQPFILTVQGLQPFILTVPFIHHRPAESSQTCTANPLPVLLLLAD